MEDVSKCNDFSFQHLFLNRNFYSDFLVIEKFSSHLCPCPAPCFLARPITTLLKIKSGKIKNSGALATFGGVSIHVAGMAAVVESADLGCLYHREALLDSEARTRSERWLCVTLISKSGQSLELSAFLCPGILKWPIETDTSIIPFYRGGH